MAEAILEPRSLPTARQALTQAGAMLRVLEAWADRRWLRDLDLALAQTLLRREPTMSPLVLLAAALVSHQAGRGHLLLRLGSVLADPDAYLTLPDAPREAPGGVVMPSTLLAATDLAGWRQALQQSIAVSNGSTRTPLVLRHDDLYLHRYWQHERRIEDAVTRRLLDPLPIEAETLRPLLDQLFPPTARPDVDTDWQKIACALCARQRFAVITGGPGTGKTTTVIRVLALLQAQALSEAPGRSLRIRLAAPTGKAAARLNQSIAAQVQSLDLGTLHDADTIRAAIPTRVDTLHRLLGSRPDTRHFAFDRERRLPVDVVVVDEASMIDEAMMAALIDALPESARLILLGDKDQLASVEAGAVLGSLCARAETGGYDAATAAWLQTASGETLDPALIASEPRPLEQAIVMLRYSHRFDATSGIGSLARAIRNGDAAAARTTLGQSHGEDLHAVAIDHADDSALLDRVLHGHGPEAPGYVACLDVLRAQRPESTDPADLDAWALAVLDAQAGFQLLCALRSGPCGVQGLNERIETALILGGHIDVGGELRHQWYEGRPVIVTANDYNLGLRNGDLGVTLRVPRTDDPTTTALRVAFHRQDDADAVHWVLPSRLQRCETVYAMTVHKSQGSEFRHTGLILPDTPSPVLTRELLYTAVTRASRAFTLFTSQPDVFEGAVGRQIQRASRLFADDEA
ncbi:MAG: exodeoxyribonuclease V subunit alpha [Gammaproteobacteria bacterium]|nr:MAG: exodeoxyribonuclease V subunit alpha [Gammaproteobacteria bacterium]